MAMLPKYSQSAGHSAIRRILLLKMIHPERLCLAKVRIAPEQQETG